MNELPGITIFRHGEANYRQKRVTRLEEADDLTVNGATGVLQSVCDWLEQARLTENDRVMILASPWGRTMTTAAIIAQRLGEACLGVIWDPDLRDQDGYRHSPNTVQDPAELETREAMDDRLRQVIARGIAACSDTRISELIVVTHDATSRGVVTEYSGGNIQHLEPGKFVRTK